MSAALSMYTNHGGIRVWLREKRRHFIMLSQVVRLIERESIVLLELRSFCTPHKTLNLCAKKDVAKDLWSTL